MSVLCSHFHTTVFVRVCFYSHVYACSCRCTSVCKSVHISTCRCLYMYVLHVGTSLCVFMHTCLLCVIVHMCLCTCLCSAHTCIHTCVLDRTCLCVCAHAYMGFFMFFPLVHMFPQVAEFQPLATLASEPFLLGMTRV